MGFPSDEGLADLIQSTGGVAVAIGGDSTYGHFETVDELVMDDGTQGVVGGVPSVVVPTGALSGLAVGAAITVAGTGYTARNHQREGDGALVRIFLAE